MSLELTFEIVAHSRFLSTVQMHPRQPWLLSAAQDSTIAVWRLPRNTEQQSVGLLDSWVWQNHMVVGAAFVDSESGEQKVAATAYSSDKIMTWTLRPGA